MKHDVTALHLIKQKPLQFCIGAGLLTLIFVGILTSTAKIGTKGYAAISSINIFKCTEQACLFRTNKNKASPNEKKIKHEYYTLQEGESLWDVAQKVYNDPYKYVQIIELNKITTADTLEKGTRLLVR